MVTILEPFHHLLHKGQIFIFYGLFGKWFKEHLTRNTELILPQTPLLLSMLNALKFQTLYSICFFCCFCFKWCFLCSCFLKYLVERQTVYTLIRFLLQEHSDLSLHCLHMPSCQKLWCTKFKLFNVTVWNFCIATLLTKWHMQTVKSLIWAWIAQRYVSHLSPLRPGFDSKCYHVTPIRGRWFSVDTLVSSTTCDHKMLSRMHL